MSVTYGLTNKHIHRIALPLTRFLINCFILICKGNVERVARDVGKLYYQLRPGPGLADRKLGPVHEVSSRYFKGTLATKNCTSVLGLIRYLLRHIFLKSSLENYASSCFLRTVFMQGEKYRVSPKRQKLSKFVFSIILPEEPRIYVCSQITLILPHYSRITIAFVLIF